MKKKGIAMILCLLMTLSGCGAAGGQRSVMEADAPIAGESAQESGEGLRAEEAGEAASESVAVLQTAIAGEKPAALHDYEKAAYLADMVCRMNGTENTIVSPLSLNMALGLAADGANGQTKEELLAYLGKEDYGAFASRYMEYAEQLNHKTEGNLIGGYQTVFEIANSVWVNENRKLMEAYAKETSERYQAEIAQVSFQPKKKDKTLQRINGWCDQKTHGMIPVILTEDDISEELSTVLVNTVYFEAPWVESWGLRQHTFTNLGGQETTQEMLSDTLSRYYENAYATAFSKSYQNGLEFIGILPKQEGDFALSDLELPSLLESERTDVDVSAIMPKLNFDTTAKELVAILQAQGVEQAFDCERADFSGMLEAQGDEKDFISDIIQKCKLELDENGTKAAAVTAIMVQRNSIMLQEREVKEVYLDRPFAFLIYDRENDQIVFIGKVVTV